MLNSGILRRLSARNVAIATVVSRLLVKYFKGAKAKRRTKTGSTSTSTTTAARKSGTRSNRAAGTPRRRKSTGRPMEPRTAF